MPKRIYSEGEQAAHATVLAIMERHRSPNGTLRGKALLRVLSQEELREMHTACVALAKAAAFEGQMKSGIDFYQKQADHIQVVLDGDRSSLEHVDAEDGVPDYEPLQIEKALFQAFVGAMEIWHEGNSLVAPVRRDPPNPRVEAFVAARWARMAPEARQRIREAFAVLGIPLQDGLID